MTFAFAAAGTGGHVYPAVSVADALVDRGVAAGEMVFFGGDRLERSAVPSAGYELVEVELQGLRRSLSPHNLKIPMVVRRAIRDIRRVLDERNVTALLGMGGYVTVPAAMAARRAGVPYFLHEQNAEPGLANRLMARRARATFIAFEAAAPGLARSELIGNPIRAVFRDFDRADLAPKARAHYALPLDMPVLGVLGGSQGAKILNETIAAMVAKRQESGAAPYALLHLAGSTHADNLRAAAQEAPIPWRVVDFEQSMELFYAASDLVLSRAGALTISELAATGTPAVVVPYAHGTAGHQAANAAGLRDAGGAVVIDEPDIATLPARVLALLGDPDARRQMAAASASQGRVDAAEVIADRLLEVAGE